MKEIVFILSSLCDPHYRKRVEEFVEQGYKVTVYGFSRDGQSIQTFPCNPIVLETISNRSYVNRLSLFRKKIKSIAKECRNKVCFYSSLDIALFARLYIKSNYIYEICDLTELTIQNPILRNYLIHCNKKTIKKSQLTIMTSEGFVEFYDDVPLDKIVIVPNKVSGQNIKPINVNRGISNSHRVRIGFVGVIRFETIYNFIKVVAETLCNVEVHLYGIYSEGDCFAEKIKQIEATSDKVFYHGAFSNPVDLPQIYSQIDLLMCTYTPSPGVVYAEPNKLYEAMFFKCPIVVNSGTFLARKVERLGIGYIVDATLESDIEMLLSNITPESYSEKIAHCNLIPETECLNINNHLFEKLRQVL